MNVLAYRLFLLSLLAFAIAYTLAARSIPMDVWTAAETVNTQTLPTAYGVSLILALSVLLIRPFNASSKGDSLQWSRLAGLCVAVALFTLSLAWVNLWIALSILLGTSAWWLGERRMRVLWLFCVLVPVTGHLLIERLLGVYLP